MTLFRIALIVAALFAGTAVVVTVNVPDVVPPLMTTEAAGLAKVLSLPNATTSPDAGAFELRLIVPVVETPPTTVVGARVIPVIIGA